MIKLYLVNLQNLNSKQRSNNFQSGFIPLNILEDEAPITKLTIQKNISKYLINRYANNLNKKIEYNKFGKPYINNGLKFNTSNSEDLIVCAVSNEEIGVDIQYCLPIFEQLDCIFHKKELLKIHSKNPYNNDLFYMIWTAKEAYVKFLGSKIDDSLRLLDFSLLKIGKNQFGNMYIYIFKIDNYFLSIVSEIDKKIEIYNVSQQIIIESVKK